MFLQGLLLLVLQQRIVLFETHGYDRTHAYFLLTNTFSDGHMHLKSLHWRGRFSHAAEGGAAGCASQGGPLQRACQGRNFAFQKFFFRPPLWRLRANELIQSKSHRLELSAARPREARGAQTARR